MKGVRACAVLQFSYKEAFHQDGGSLSPAQEEFRTAVALNLGFSVMDPGPDASSLKS